MPSRRPVGSLLALTALALWALPAASLAGTLTGPVVDADGGAAIVDVAAFPATGVSPLAGLNMVAEVPDGSGRLFVCDLRGPLYVLDGTTLHTYLDASAVFPDFFAIAADGLIAFVFHPGFATNGLFYTVHSESINPGTPAPNMVPALATTFIQHAVLTEWQATDPSANAFAGTSRELMRVGSHHRAHNMAELTFDPSQAPGDPEYGLLYIASGDFGSVRSGRPQHLQRLDTPYGTIMRIDPAGGPFTRGGVTFDYGIPAGNPFIDGDPNTLDEIFAYGTRNAHRLSWDVVTGTLFSADIGEANVEEVNVVTAQRNFGWPVREGTFAIDVTSDPDTVFALPANDPSLGFTYPVSQYDHDEGFAIAGGVAYRGLAVPELFGKFVFGDIVTGRLLYSDLAEMIAADDGDPSTTAQVNELTLIRNGAPTTLLELVRAETGNPNLARVDLRLALDAAGEILITTKQDGLLRQLVARTKCADGIDNDGDGATDFAGGDPGCRDAAGTTESPQCQNGLDDDGAPGTDFDGGVSVLGVGNGDPAGPDPECTAPWRNREAPPARRCGLGVELVPLLGAIVAWRTRSARPGPGSERR